MDVKLDSIMTCIYALVVYLSLVLVVKVINWAWLRPKKLEKFLRMQGIKGNSYRFIIGDLKEVLESMIKGRWKTMGFSDNLPSHILPYFHNVIRKYGEACFIWAGPTPVVNIADPELMKEILARPGIFHKPPREAIFGIKFLGGVLTLEDEEWKIRRTIINTAFHLDKLKKMIPAMYLSCSNMVGKWESFLSSNGKTFEIDVWPFLSDLTGDVISRTAFGSSHKEGKKIFDLQREQVWLVLQLIQFTFIPGWRYLPTKANRRMRAISKEIESLLRGIINQRERKMERGEMIKEDLLGILMESTSKEITHENSKKMGLSIEDVIEECKLFYFAGSETSSNLLVWSMVMLGKHREWQSRAREEVVEVFGKNEPTFNDLNQLKTVTMILYEVLRIYPPAPWLIREATETVKLGSMIMPKGAQLVLLVGLLHHDPTIWGDDVNEFRPDRFSKGIPGASNTRHSFVPFSSGPRVCLGQTFAMTEAKLALAMILLKFSFELSPNYQHAPFPVLTLQPQYGAPILLHKL